MTNKKKKRDKSATKQKWPDYAKRRAFEGIFILCMGWALYLFLALATYSPLDSAWFTKEPFYNPDIVNAGGQLGAIFSDFMFAGFGFVAFLFPLGFASVAMSFLQDSRSIDFSDKSLLWLRIAGLVAAVLGGCGLLALWSQPNDVLQYGSGGVCGYWVAFFSSYALNHLGASVLLLALFLMGITWMTGLSWLRVTSAIGYLTIQLSKLSMQLGLGIRYIFRRLHKSNKVTLKKADVAVETQVPATLSQPQASPQPAVSLGGKTKKSQKIDKEPIVVTTGLPGLSLLTSGQNKKVGGYSQEQLSELSEQVEQHLADFGVTAEVVAVLPGPVITRFELQLAAGVKVSKLTALAKDLARSLSVTRVRVVEVIPGKTVVGIELPNQSREMVRLSEVLGARVYQEAHSKITLALGVDIAGAPFTVDLAKMPHLLVAGTTGSGKSVGINAMILSILLKSTPDEVRLIMVDPKMLELSVYDGIPHLLTPVVTDMKEAASALRWCVAEMERRYRLMAAVGVRNLAGFNQKVADAKAKGAPLKDPLWRAATSVEEAPSELNTLPLVVVVIDELADMMMVVGKKVEQLIARIAQKARAAGIHLILATQRPSVDVLTGLIKSNIPTRISFQVSSKIDSRTILDQQGAEQLLGNGDMLFLVPGSGAPIRVHGAFVDDSEVHRVADDWRARGEPEYIEEIVSIADSEGDEDGQSTEEKDALFDEAVAFVAQTRKASISAVQRRFKVGYNRAARLVEEMERVGIVGPLEGGYREVLVSHTE